MQNRKVVVDSRQDVREMPDTSSELKALASSEAATVKLPLVSAPLDDSRPRPGAMRSLLASATVAECSLEHMLSLESVLSRGELTADSKRGTFLYVSAVSPRYLESAQPTRVSYISALFRQWRGSLRLRLYVTKAIFQQTKLLLVFIPGALPSEMRLMSLDTLMGAECKTVMNPSNDEVAVLDVPFVHTSNWQAVNGSTGAVALVLLERIVITQETTSTIPWILTCCSPPGESQLRFRYGIAPPVPSSSGGGSGGGDGDGDSGVSVSSFIGESYALSSSSRRRRRIIDGRATTSTDLVASQPLVRAPSKMLVGVAVNWGRCPSSQRLARKLARLPLAPPFSFTFDAPSSQRTLVPYLPVLNWVQGPLPNLQSGYPTSYDWWYSQSNNKIENGLLWFGHSEGAMEFVVNMSMHPGIAAQYDGWLVDLIIAWNDSTVPNLVVFKAVSENSGQRLRLKFQGRAIPEGSAFRTKIGWPMQWVDDPRNYNRGPQIGNFLERQITAARDALVAPYFMLWVGGRSPTAEAIRDWLYEDTDSLETPKLAQGSLVSFSLSQAPGLFDMTSETESRGLFTWIYSLFSSDNDSALYKVARVADIIFEFALPLLVSYEGEPALVDATAVTYRFLEASEGVSRMRLDGARVVHDLPPIPEETDALVEAEIGGSAPADHQPSLKHLFRRLALGSSTDTPATDRRRSRRRRHRRSRGSVASGGSSASCCHSEREASLPTDDH